MTEPHLHSEGSSTNSAKTSETGGSTAVSRAASNASASLLRLLFAVVTAPSAADAPSAVCDTSNVSTEIAMRAAAASFDGHSPLAITLNQPSSGAACGDDLGTKAAQIAHYLIFYLRGCQYKGTRLTCDEAYDNIAGTEAPQTSHFNIAGTKTAQIAHFISIERVPSTRHTAKLQ